MLCLFVCFFLDRYVYKYHFHVANRLEPFDTHSLMGYHF